MFILSYFLFNVYDLIVQLRDYDLDPRARELCNSLESLVGNKMEAISRFFFFWCKVVSVVRKGLFPFLKDVR